ncbi:purine-cytosine permease family protein [Gephyromycinifex aptenodytis]|uniref:purine-cytosine permease family protein n=1 Tax=Gephyromycinifex aptenodytis TaxID=2716227 RepID=UPI001446C34B|nr:cytosine permease [Gephyromycinifex aptenodytis]
MPSTPSSPQPPAPPSLRSVERRSIDVVPPAERTGTPRSQFTLWLGANMQITAVVDGALAVVFGADAWWAIVGLLIGNVLGGIVMALHSAQGPRLGLPQMISSRAQFGVLGAALPLILVVIMYLGFAATGTLLSGQAINKMLGTETPAVGIVIFGLLTLLVAVFGYQWIHLLGRIATVTGLLGFAYLFVRLLAEHSVGELLAPKEGFVLATFLLAVSVSAGWQLVYGPYVADYSRYLPADTPAAHTFWGTFLGSVIGSQIAMTFGALVASVPGNGFLTNQVGVLGALAGSAAMAFVIYLVIVIGKLAVNCLNAYGGFMTILTTITGFTRRDRVSRGTRIALIAAFVTISMLIALLASSDFIATFKNFILVLLMVFTPWSAINLVDYYLVSKERVDIPALYDREGRYGSWNVPALAVYLIGVAVQLPFLAQAMYTGPVTKMLGGVDISWIVGLIVTGALYYPLARRQNLAPERLIYPAEAALNTEDLAGR